MSLFNCDRFGAERFDVFEHDAERLIDGDHNSQPERRETIRAKMRKTEQ
jgi:hypothetical protein